MTFRYARGSGSVGTVGPTGDTTGAGPAPTARSGLGPLSDRAGGASLLGLPAGLWAPSGCSAPAGPSAPSGVTAPFGFAAPFGLAARSVPGPLAVAAAGSSAAGSGGTGSNSKDMRSIR